MLSQGHDGLTRLCELHGDPITSDMQTGHFINDFEISIMGKFRTACSRPAGGRGQSFGKNC